MPAVLSAGSVKRTGRLTICAEAKPSWFDAHNQIAGAARILATNIVPGLLSIGETGRPSPSLATAWDWEDDRTLSLELAPGRCFATGRRVDATAVVENLERAILAPGSVFNQVEFQPIKECIPVGETGLLLRLRRPFAPLPGVLANGFGMIDLKSGAPPGNTQGAGRFRIRRSTKTSLELQSRVGPERTIEWAFCTTAGSRRRRISLGTADVLIGEAGVQFATARGWTVKCVAGDGPIHLAFNLRRWPGSSKGFRRRVSEALDRDDVIAQGFSGRGRTGTGPFAPGTAFHFEASPDATSRPSEKARPRKLPELELAVGGTAYATAARAIARAIEKALRVHVHVVSVANPQWWPDYYMRGSWDMALQAWTPMPDPHLVYARRYASSGFHNAPGYANAQLDSAVRAAESCLDRTLRLSYYAEAEAIRASDLPTIYVGFPDRLLTSRPNVEPPSMRATWEIDL
jgi:peptide/nickel transport system substrate-binding protein